MRATHCFITFEFNAAWKQTENHVFYRALNDDGTEAQVHVTGQRFADFLAAFPDFKTQLEDWIKSAPPAIPGAGNGGGGGELP